MDGSETVQQLALALPACAEPAPIRVQRVVALVTGLANSLPMRSAEQVALETADRFPLSEASFKKYSSHWHNFVRYAETEGTRTVDGITERLCAAWISAASVVDEYPVPPEPDTQHNRRASLRNLFARLRAYGAMDGDPTIDIKLPPRSGGTSRRRLEDDEIDLCRLWSVQTLTDTRQPAVWALAEASATPGEIALVRIRDIDLYACRVYLCGTSQVCPRWARLTEWGCEELRLRVNALGGGPETLMALNDAGKAGSASCSAALRAVLVRAGLGHERDVKPTSVRAWAGWKVLEETGHIEAAATALGLKSLDSAASLVGHSWAAVG